MTPEEMASQFVDEWVDGLCDVGDVPELIAKAIRQAIAEEREANREIAARIAMHYFAEHVDPDLDTADETAAYKACEEIRDAILNRP